MATQAEESRKLPVGDTSIGAVRKVHGRAAGETTTNFNSSSRDVAKDLFEGGRVPILLLGSLTVRGCAVVRSVQQSRDGDQDVVHPDEKPFSAIHGIAGSQGSLAPHGAVVKAVGMAGLKIAEPARFDGEEARFRTVKNKKYREGEVLVIRNERPQRGPGMREALAIREGVARKGFSTAMGAGGTRPGDTAEACHAPV